MTAEKLHDTDTVLTFSEIEELQNTVYEMSSSWLPFSDFFNDIRDNRSPTFDKNQAYKDLWLIVLVFNELHDARDALRIAKNKSVDMKVFFFQDCADNYNRYVKAVENWNKDNYEGRLLTQEEYELIARA